MRETKSAAEEGGMREKKIRTKSPGGPPILRLTATTSAPHAVCDVAEPGKRGGNSAALQDMPGG